MKSVIMVVLLLGSSFNIVSALQQIPMVTPTRCIGRSLAASSNGDDAAQEKYLDSLWNELKKTERDIIVQEEIEGRDKKDVTKHLVEEMLGVALEHVKTKERIEAKHAKAAHEAFETAIQEEQVLQEFVEEEELHDVPMDTFVSDRLQAAEEAEMKAMKEEEESVQVYQDLKASETNIKATLEALKRLER